MSTVNYINKMIQNHNTSNKENELLVAMGFKSALEAPYINYIYASAKMSDQASSQVVTALMEKIQNFVAQAQLLNQQPGLDNLDKDAIREMALTLHGRYNGIKGQENAPVNELKDKINALRDLLGEEHLV